MKIEVSDVKGEEACMWGRDDTVDEEFGKGEVAHGGCGGAFILDAVAVHSETDTMGFHFEGANGSDDATVGDLCTFGVWDVGVRDECDGVGAFCG